MEITGRETYLWHRLYISTFPPFFFYKVKCLMFYIIINKLCDSVWILHEFYLIIHLFCCVFSGLPRPRDRYSVDQRRCQMDGLVGRGGWESLWYLYKFTFVIISMAIIYTYCHHIYRKPMEVLCSFAIHILLKGIMFTTPNPSLKTTLLKKSFQDNTIFIILWELMLDLFLTINGFPFFRFPFLRMFTICHDLCCHPLYLELDQSWVQNQLQFCVVIFSI